MNDKAENAAAATDAAPARPDPRRAMKPVVLIVGADKGGVGKTTIARALINHLLAHNVSVRAFDTETPRGTLRRFHPGQTDIVDIGEVTDQMKILDTLESSGAAVTVIDIRAGQLGDTLQMLSNIGFMDAARNGDFALGLVHVLGPSIASLDEISEIAPQLAGAEYVLARNFVNDADFFEWDSKTYAKYFSKVDDATEIEIPKLNEMAYEQVDLANARFDDFVTNRDPGGEAAQYSFVLRGYVRKWIADIEPELQRIGLVNALTSGGRR
jgi:hypothetical protein